MMARTNKPMDISSILNSRTVGDNCPFDVERRSSCSSEATSTSDEDYSRLNGRTYYRAGSPSLPTPPNFSPSISNQRPFFPLPACLQWREAPQNFERPQLPSVHTILAPTLDSSTPFMTRRRSPSPVITLQQTRRRVNRRRDSGAPGITFTSPFHQVPAATHYQFHSPSPQYTRRSQAHHQYVTMRPPSPPPSPPANTAHSNKAYSIEQVHFIRYLKEDGQKKWPEVMARYHSKWPEDSFRGSTQCFSARYYRDNWLPMVDVNFNLVLDGEGKVLVILDKVRTKFGAPTKMVDKHPEAVLQKKYSWMDVQDRIRAKETIIEDEAAVRDGQLSQAGKWREVVLDVERRFKSSSRHEIKPTEITQWERQLGVRFFLRPAGFVTEKDGNDDE